ncbi:hypothetical protein MOC12_21130 [Bacillus spizizenii]|nr:hypothetical protein [Bacillus spizizenii]
MYDRFDRFMIGLIVLCGILLVVSIFGAVQESKACHARGGTMEGTGHYITTFVQTGSATVPVMVEETECTR